MQNRVFYRWHADKRMHYMHNIHDHKIKFNSFPTCPLITLLASSTLPLLPPPHISFFRTVIRFSYQNYAFVYLINKSYPTQTYIAFWEPEIEYRQAAKKTLGSRPKWQVYISYKLCPHYMRVLFKHVQWQMQRPY